MGDATLNEVLSEPLRYCERCWKSEVSNIIASGVGGDVLDIEKDSDGLWCCAECDPAVASPRKDGGSNG